MRTAADQNEPAHITGHRMNASIISTNEAITRDEKQLGVSNDYGGKKKTCLLNGLE